MYWLLSYVSIHKRKFWRLPQNIFFTNKLSLKSVWDLVYLYLSSTESPIHISGVFSTRHRHRHREYTDGSKLGYKFRRDDMFFRLITRMTAITSKLDYVHIHGRIYDHQPCSNSFWMKKSRVSHFSVVKVHAEHGFFGNVQRIMLVIRRSIAH